MVYHDNPHSGVLEDRVPLNPLFFIKIAILGDTHRYQTHDAPISS